MKYKNFLLEKSFKKLNVWCANRWLTCDGNTIYTPQFLGNIQEDLKILQSSDRTHAGKRPYPTLSFSDNLNRLLDIPEDVELDKAERFNFFFMQWGPTSDNISMLLFRENNYANLVFQFWRPDHHNPDELKKVYTTCLLIEELEKLLSDVIRHLDER